MTSSIRLFSYIRENGNMRPTTPHIGRWVIKQNLCWNCISERRKPSFRIFCQMQNLRNENDDCRMKEKSPEGKIYHSFGTVFFGKGSGVERQNFAGASADFPPPYYVVIWLLKNRRFNWLAYLAASYTIYCIRNVLPNTIYGFCFICGFFLPFDCGEDRGVIAGEKGVPL